MWVVVKILKRWKEHLYKLKYGVHHSVKLQRSYDRIEDKSVFKFEVIEKLRKIC